MNYGIHINATEKFVNLESFEGGFKGMKRVLGIDIAEAIDLGNGVTLWCDEDGRLKSEQHWFKFNGKLIAGSAMVVFGDYVNPDFSDQCKINTLVKFVSEEQLADEEVEPEMGFIGSKAELDAAIAAGKISPALADFFN